MVYGYARVSTKGQAKDGNSLEAQEVTLRAAGATKIFMDTFTGTTTDRPEFDELLACLNSGDTLVVTKLDRIARSATEGSRIVHDMLNKGVGVHVLNMGVMDNSPTGKLVCQIMFAFAEFERDMIVERTQEGKAVARRHPDYKEGRPKKYSRKQMEHAMELLHDHSYKQVTDLTGISKSTLIRERKSKIKENCKHKNSAEK